MKILSVMVNDPFMGAGENLDACVAGSHVEPSTLAVGRKNMRDTLILIAIVVAQFAVVVATVL
jgi:hypothetical protein